MSAAGSRSPTQLNFPTSVPTTTARQIIWTTDQVGAANLVYFFDFMTGAADGHTRGFQLAVRLVKTAK
jgi:hypothetical protein